MALGPLGITHILMVSRAGSVKVSASYYTCTQLTKHWGVALGVGVVGRGCAGVGGG